MVRSRASIKKARYYWLVGLLFAAGFFISERALFVARLTDESHRAKARVRMHTGVRRVIREIIEHP